MTGRASTRSTWTTRIIQVNTGIFIRSMPGARMLSTVTVRLTALASEAMPVMSRPRVKKSRPCDGEKTTPVFGA